MTCTVSKASKAMLAVTVQPLYKHAIALPISLLHPMISTSAPVSATAGLQHGMMTTRGCLLGHPNGYLAVLKTKQDASYSMHRNLSPSPVTTTTMTSTTADVLGFEMGDDILGLRDEIPSGVIRATLLPLHDIMGLVSVSPSQMCLTSAPQTFSTSCISNSTTASTESMSSPSNERDAATATATGSTIDQGALGTTSSVPALVTLCNGQLSITHGLTNRALPLPGAGSATSAHHTCLATTASLLAVGYNSGRIAIYDSKTLRLLKLASCHVTLSNSNTNDKVLSPHMSSTPEHFKDTSLIEKETSQTPTRTSHNNNKNPNSSIKPKVCTMQLQ
jgi:hypothetical protein